MAMIGFASAVADASSRTLPENCKNYVLCFEATGGTKGSLDSTYGSMGTCWATTDLPARECERACMNALTTLSAMHPDAGCAAVWAPRAPGCG